MIICENSSASILISYTDSLALPTRNSGPQPITSAHEMYHILKTEAFVLVSLGKCRIWISQIHWTSCREVARMLADEYEKRVVIVDTSNEIAGDGDIPHAGIGMARRMQVPKVDLQHKVRFDTVFSHFSWVFRLW